MKSIVVALCLLSAGTAMAGENKNTVRGAVYVPTKAYNAPQMWKNYSPEITRRDMGYAKKVNVNAFRIWTSYEYWRINQKYFKEAFDDFLDAAEEFGIGVYPSLFENCGVPPTDQAMWWSRPDETVCVNSPHKKEIGANPDRWNETEEYVKWFMDNYKNDKRLLAIEVMNEPSKEMVVFAQAMLKVAVANKGSRPLTIGTAGPGGTEKFIDIGVDIIQFHNNFPTSRKEAKANIDDAVAAGKKYGLPVWMAEWQRIRPSGAGFKQKDEGVPEEDRYSNYKSMADLAHQYEIGTFFWSLMVKPAYLAGQRANGTVNGLFWEDGSVWSLEDARAIANDPTLQLEERQEPDFSKIMGQ
jgi:hypothetical protein